MAKAKKVTEKAPAEDQQPSETAGASAGGGRVTQRNRARRAEPAGKINGSVWEAGRGYKTGDEAEFEKLNLSEEKLQFLANQKVITPEGEKYLIEGFGVEPNEDAEELNEGGVTGVGSPGRRANAGARGRPAADEDVEDEDTEEEE